MLKNARFEKKAEKKKKAKFTAQATISRQETSKPIVEKKIQASTLTSTRKAQMERIQEVYRHYTVNDQNTLGMGGFLKFLKDLNLLKDRLAVAKQQQDLKE